MCIPSRLVACFSASAVLIVLTATSSLAQSSIEALWPNKEASKWSFDFEGWELGSDGNPAFIYGGTAKLLLMGNTNTPGGVAQNLFAFHEEPVPTKANRHLSPLYRNLWKARPDLRGEIEALARQRPGNTTQSADWVPVLLHGGLFMKSSDRVEMWQPGSLTPTWTYLAGDLVVNQEFTRQLVPDLADDVFLHGKVEANDANVSIPAGTFSHAVKIAYDIDYGVADIIEVIDDTPVSIGTFRSWTSGWVQYVPGVGPADMQEEFTLFTELDCAECPEEVLGLEDVVVFHVTMKLRTGPTSVESQPWGAIKQLYR